MRGRADRETCRPGCCRSACASPWVEHGVLPVLTTCFGPRTAAAGHRHDLPGDQQLNSMRMAASSCFTDGADNGGRLAAAAPE